MPTAEFPERRFSASPPGFDSPHDAVQENGTYGGQGKAVGCVPPAALLFEQRSTLTVRGIKASVVLMLARPSRLQSLNG